MAAVHSTYPAPAGRNNPVAAALVAVRYSRLVLGRGRSHLVAVGQGTLGWDLGRRRVRGRRMGWGRRVRRRSGLEAGRKGVGRSPVVR